MTGEVKRIDSGLVAVERREVHLIPVARAGGAQVGDLVRLAFYTVNKPVVAEIIQTGATRAALKAYTTMAEPDAALRAVEARTVEEAANLRQALERVVARLEGFVGASAEYTDCSEDVEALKAADAVLARIRGEQ